MQTTYSNAPAVAINGLVTECQPYDKISRQAKGAVKVGTLVLLGDDAPSGVNPGQCKAIPDATASVVNAAGIVVYDAAREPYTNGVAPAQNQYSDKDMVPLMRKGRIWVYVENAVTQGNPVYVRITAAGTDVTGQFRDGAVANFIAFPNAVFLTSTAGSGLAEIEVK
jgi:hypothetical protein